MKIIFIAMLVSVNCYAKQYDYKKFWSASDLVKMNETSSFGIEIKTSPLIANLPIATVSYTKNNKEPKEKVITLLKKSVLSKKWSLEQMDGLEIYETYSKETGTIYRLAYNNKNNEFSLASIAVRYVLPTYLETHLIQLKHLKTVKSSSNKFTQFMSIFLQNAYAQSPSYQVDINIDTQQLNGAIDQLGNGISGLNGHLDATSGAINNLSGATNNISGSINNMADSVNNTSNTLKELTSPKTVARTAAIAGVAFGVTNTLASMATNFLVNGSMSMLRTLYYEAAGELKPEEKEARLKRFENSMKSFTELSPKLNELANKMAATSIEITLASGVTQEQYLTNIDQELEKARKAKTEASTDCMECQTELVLKIAQLENLKEIVKHTGNKTKEDLKKSCENMDNLYHEWVNAEYVILNSRRLIMQDLLIFNGQIVENAQQDDAFQESRKKANSCRSGSQKVINNIKSEIDVNKCTASEENMELPICRRYFAHIEILNNCDALADTQLNEAQQTELVEATARFSSSLSQFSRSLASMSCENNAASCTKTQMDKARGEVAETFKTMAEQCPGRFFADAMKKSTKLKAPEVNKPKPKDNRNFLQRIFSGGSDNPNKNVAHDLSNQF